eukprot:686580-Amorphochlora_amoeboformis.AAC.3
MSRAVVLHEDKVYYPHASEGEKGGYRGSTNGEVANIAGGALYPEAEVLVEDEDTQPLETPIIAPVKNKQFSHVEKKLPSTSFDMKFLAGMMDHPNLIRNIAFIGNLHHGKTSLMDLLVKETHVLDWTATKNERYTDTRFDEQKRKISIKSMPMSL